MTSYFSSDFKLAVVGGGQLGKMLLYETRKFDIQTRVLDPSPEAPARLAANYFEQGDLMDFDTVYNFGKEADVITFEIEAVNVEALERLQAEGKSVFPAPETLRKIQNKGDQKDFYSEKNIPTAPYTRFENLEALKLSLTANQISFPFVWKST